MSIQSGITTGTPSKILFGAGVYFKGVTYDEKTAPTEEQIKAAIFGATQEGGTLTITPEFFMPELDGATVEIAELQKKIGEKGEMDVSFVELTSELMSKMVIGKIADAGDYEVITSAELTKGHFLEGFGFYGELMDGRPVIIMFKKALCKTGFTADPKNKTNAAFKGTFACQSDIEYSTTKLPYAIFIRKAEGWVPANPDEAAA